VRGCLVDAFCWCCVLEFCGLFCVVFVSLDIDFCRFFFVPNP